MYMSMSMSMRMMHMDLGMYMCMWLRRCMAKARRRTERRVERGCASLSSAQLGPA